MESNEKFQQFKKEKEERRAQVECITENILTERAIKDFEESMEFRLKKINIIESASAAIEKKKHYNVEQVSSSCDSLNEIVKKRENEGWTLVPPILLQPSIMENGNLYVAGHYTLTFEKEA